MATLYRTVKFSPDLPTGDYIVVQPDGRVSNYHHVKGHDDVIGIDVVFQPINPSESIESRALELWPKSYHPMEDDKNKNREKAIALAPTNPLNGSWGLLVVFFTLFFNLNSFT